MFKTFEKTIMYLQDTDAVDVDFVLKQAREELLEEARVIMVNDSYYVISFSENTVKDRQGIVRHYLILSVAKAHIVVGLEPKSDSYFKLVDWDTSN